MPRNKNNVVPISLKSGAEVRQYVDRFVKLLGERADAASAIADLKQEARGNGHDPKALMILAKRETETADARAKRIALEQEIERLEAALGILAETPLGQSATARAAGALQ